MTWSDHSQCQWPQLLQQGLHTLASQDQSRASQETHSHLVTPRWTVTWMIHPLPVLWALSSTIRLYERLLLALNND